MVISCGHLGEGMLFRGLVFLLCGPSRLTLSAEHNVDFSGLKQGQRWIQEFTLGEALLVPFRILSHPAPLPHGLMHDVKIFEGKEKTTLACLFVLLELYNCSPWQEISKQSFLVGFQRHLLPVAPVKESNGVALCELNGSVAVNR